jgi:hypothetical protein
MILVKVEDNGNVFAFQCFFFCFVDSLCFGWSVLECHPPSLSPISSNYVLCNILCVGLKSYPVVNQWVVLQTKGVMQAKLDNQEIRWHGGVRLKFVSMVNC